VGQTYLTALCPACGAAQGDGAVDGCPPRPHPGDWRGRVVPARWRLEPDGAAAERRVRSPAALRHGGRSPISGRHDGRADALLLPSG
jgi:hypothetical protein